MVVLENQRTGSGCQMIEYELAVIPKSAKPKRRYETTKKIVRSTGPYKSLRFKPPKTPKRYQPVMPLHVLHNMVEEVAQLEEAPKAVPPVDPKSLWARELDLRDDDDT